MRNRKALATQAPPRDSQDQKPLAGSLLHRFPSKFTNSAKDKPRDTIIVANMFDAPQHYFRTALQRARCCTLQEAAAT